MSGRIVRKDFAIYGLDEKGINALIRTHAAEKGIPRGVEPQVEIVRGGAVASVTWVWVED